LLQEQINGENLKSELELLLKKNPFELYTSSLGIDIKTLKFIYVQIADNNKN
jgi:hypothetical protein